MELRLFCTNGEPIDTWVILRQAGKFEFAKRHKICHFISFVLLLFPSQTPKFLSYIALAVHDIQHNRFYSQLKCTMFENSVNCVTGQPAPFFS